MPQVSVIIVNYNSGGRLGRCLKHLRAQTFQEFETIVVDNQSADGSADEARADPAVQIIDAGANLGFAAANNLGARQAKGAWLAFLNPDAYAAPDWLEKLMDAARRRPDVSAFGSTQINAVRRDLIDGAGDVYLACGFAYRGGFGKAIDALPPEGECFAPCAAAALIRRQTFLDLGGFYEPFFCYSEDVDFGFRLRLAGGSCVQARDAVVYHEGSGVTGRRSDFTIYHGHRNRIWTYWLNMPLLLLLATVPFHLALNFLLLAKSVADGNGGAYLRAMKDGFGGLPGLADERRRRHAARKASLGEIARALSWSPLKLVTRATDVRPAR